jgi:hypothetical protein
MSRYRHRPERRAWKTRAQEQRENREADDLYRRERAEEDARIAAAMRAQWEALPAETRAEIEEREARIRAQSHADYIAHEEWKARRDRDRNDPMSTSGT